MRSSVRVWREPRPGSRMLMMDGSTRRRLPRGWIAWDREEDEGFSLNPRSFSSSASSASSIRGLRVLGDVSRFFLGFFFFFLILFWARGWKNALGILRREGRVRKSGA